MGREIDVYAVGHHSRRGYFLIREKGKPDYRVAKPADVTLLEAVKIIAAANEADSVHIVLNNNPTKKPKIEVFAHLPLDETCKIEYSISNSVQAESPAKSPADIAASIPESEASTGSEKKLPVMPTLYRRSPQRSPQLTSLRLQLTSLRLQPRSLRRHPKARQAREARKRPPVKRPEPYVSGRKASRASSKERERTV